MTWPCFFLKQTKNTWKTNAQIRFVLDLAMLNTFQFGPGVPSQVVERPPRRPLGCVTNLQICWMLWHWTRCEKDWPASSTLCWQLSDDLKEQFSEVWLGTLWCTRHSITVYKFRPFYLDDYVRNPDMFGNLNRTVYDQSRGASYRVHVFSLEWKWGVIKTLFDCFFVGAVIQPVW